MRNIDWYHYAGKYGRQLLDLLGLHSTDDIRYRIQDLGYNPVAYELEVDPQNFMRLLEHAGEGKVNITGACRALIMAQMVLFDDQRGPDKDDQMIAIREHWYRYFKKFAQNLAPITGKMKQNKTTGVMEMDDTAWSGRQSQIMKAIVDGGSITYQDLWVEDASRKMEVFGHSNSLFPDIQIIVAVEKATMHNKYIDPARALGAVAVVAGGGKMAYAGTEKLLRELGWEERNDVAYRDTLIITITDWDYDGEAVISPTFSTQAKRYLKYVTEGRAGIYPWQVEQVHGVQTDATWEKTYKIKQGHNGYQEWAEDKALYWSRCDSCGHETYINGIDHYCECPECGEPEQLISDADLNEPRGFEVEALGSRDYYKAMVDALLRHIPFNDLIEVLRFSEKPRAEYVTERIRDEILKKNVKYQKVKHAAEVLRRVQWDLENKLYAEIEAVTPDVIEGTTLTWAYSEEDPDPAMLYRHVEGGGYGRWQPFDLRAREQIVMDALYKDEDLIREWETFTVRDYDETVTDVRLTLES